MNRHHQTKVHVCCFFSAVWALLVDGPQLRGWLNISTEMATSCFDATQLTPFEIKISCKNRCTFITSLFIADYSDAVLTCAMVVLSAQCALFEKRLH